MKNRKAISNAKNRKHIEWLIARLNKFYPVFTPKAQRDPLDELVYTILSQATNDRNSLAAFRLLKQKFPSWDKLVTAKPSEIEKAIHVGGLAPTKSKRIKELVKTIAKRNIDAKELRDGSPYHMEFLRGMTLDDARAYLTSLDGVGEKTAACILLFSLSMPAFPIDTHVFRILQRQGIIASNINPEKAHGIMYELIEPDERYRLHVNMIQYGREVCHARNPECDRCVIREKCLYNQK